MFIVCYLAQDDRNTTALRERLALAKQPNALLQARSVPEMVSLMQTVPIKAIITDITLPRATWSQVEIALRSTHPTLPLFALSAGPTEEEWWAFARDLLRLDENSDLFLHRLAQFEAAVESVPSTKLDSPDPAFLSFNPVMVNTPTYAGGQANGLLENSQFRQFAGIFSSQDEPSIIDAFVAWVQQACLTSRVVLLLRNEETGDFECQAQRGLPSTLVPHCVFPATAPICLWLATTGHILVRDQGTGYIPRDVLNGLDLLQAAVAVPTMSDGQLIGILGIGPRLVGHGYSATELEGLFTLGGQIALTLQHFRMHRTIREHQEMTENMLRGIPTGIVVLGADNRIAFINPAAAVMLDADPLLLQGMDLRALPSPLGDTAFEALVRHIDIPRREMTISTTNFPVAVTCIVLGTLPPSSMLLLEDLSARKQLEEEHDRRIDLEVVTNLVHYLAHELRNPLVALSTFNNLVTSRAGDADFQEFCESVLQTEIDRVNLLLEQLLVLTHHAEFQFSTVELAPLLERMTESAEMRSSIVTAVPVTIPPLYGDAHRLETAITCILRTAMRLAHRKTPVTLQVTAELDEVIIRIEALADEAVTPEWLLNPWQQLMGKSDQDVDFGLATARYIIEQHNGSMNISLADNALVILCRLPFGTPVDDNEDKRHHEQRASTRR